MGNVRAGIIQSNYIPWKGYFDFIDSVDVFVVFDDVQYTRRDWRNRNVIKTKDGTKWLTIPVDAKGKYHQAINATRIADSGWAREHLATLRHAYGRAAHFESEWLWIESLYEECAGLTHLTQVNVTMLRGICRRLGITTPLRLSSEFALPEGKNERLISLCHQLGASQYLSGPAARDYIDLDVWQSAGIDVRFKSYAGYPEYAQMHGAFNHYVTILDLFFNAGDEARRYFKSEVDVQP